MVFWGPRADIEHHSLGRQIDRGRPVGEPPGRRLCRRGCGLIWHGPPFWPQARRLRQRNSEQVFDLPKTQHDTIRESIAQVRVQAIVLANTWACHMPPPCNLDASFSPFI
jgi:hypothetical protein